MPTYQVTAPDGNSYEITAPEGASEDEVLSYAKQNYGNAEEVPKEEKGFLGRLSEMRKAFGEKITGNALKSTVGTVANIGKSAEIGMRSTADLPLAAIQKVGDATGGLELSELGREGLSAVSDNLAPEDLDDMDVSESIARVTGKTDELTAEAGIPGMLTRGVTQAAQVPIPSVKWLTEGKVISQMLRTGTYSAATGAATGYMQPQAADTVEEREANRQSGALTGLTYGGAIGMASPLAGGGFRLARDYFTRKGAQDVVAKELAESFGTGLGSQVAKLDEGIARADRMNAGITDPNAMYKPTTNSILNAPELDPYNLKANSKTDRLVNVSNQQTQNVEFAKTQADKYLDPNANMDSLRATAKELIDDPVTLINDAKKIVKDKGLTGAQARAAEGRYIRQIVDAYDETADRFYGELKDLPAQAEPFLATMDSLTQDNKALKSALSTRPVLKKLIPDEAAKTNTTRIVKVEDLRQANSDLSALIKDAERTSNYTLFNELVDLKTSLKDFMRDHPDIRIKNASQRADEFYTEYRDALRRGDGSASAIMRIEEKLRSANYKTVNDSELGNMVIRKGEAVAPENVQDYKKLGQEAQKMLGITDATEDLTRQKLLTSFKDTMRNAPTPSKMANWMSKWEVVLDEFPKVKDEFQKLQSEVLENPEVALANKLANPEGAFSERATFKQWIDNPDTMDKAISIAKKDKSGKSSEELRKQFSQWIKNNITALDTPQSVDSFRKMFNPDTTEGKAVKKLFESAPDEYAHYKDVSAVFKELQQDLTRNPGRRAGIEETKDALSQGIELAATAKGFTPYRIARAITDFAKSTPAYMSIIDEMTRDPKFAKQVFEWSKNPKSKEFAETTRKLTQITAGKASAAATTGLAPRATEGQEEKPKPKYTPNDIAVMEKSLQKSKK